MALEEEEGILDLGDTIKTGIPRKSGHDIWLYLMARGFDKFDNMLVNLNGSTDFKPYLFARSMILKIPEDEIRYKLIKMFDDEIEKIRKEPGLSNEDRGLKRLILAQNVLGEVMAYVDEYIGLSRTIVIPKM